jgi:hypothetical protein
MANLRVESPAWAFHPNPGDRNAAAWVSPEEYAFIMGRGYVLIDGQRADVVEADCECDDRRGFVRVRFVDERGWEPPERGEMLGIAQGFYHPRWCPR